MKTSVLIFILTLTSLAASGQTVGEVTDSVKEVLKHGSIKEKVNTIKGAFASKAASAEQLVGTWTYVQPAVLATSGNLFFKTIGNTVASQLEDLITGYFIKAQVTPENTSITFREDGTFTRSVAGREAEGRWMAGGGKICLGVQNVLTASPTTHMEHDTLTLVVEAQKLMSALQALGGFSDSKTNNALVKLSKHLSGLQAGFLMARKKE